MNIKLFNHNILNKFKYYMFDISSLAKYKVTIEIMALCRLQEKLRYCMRGGVFE